MYVMLNEPERYGSSIVRFRREICAHMGVMPGPTAVDPPPYALYLFGFREDLCEPVCMVEFFFYDRAYTDYRSAPYNQAYDLTQTGAMHEVAHVRSVIVTHACFSFCSAA